MRLKRRGFGFFALLATLPGVRAESPGAAVSRPDLVAIIAAASFELFPHRSVAASAYEALADGFVDADEERSRHFVEALGGSDFLRLARKDRLDRLHAQETSADFFALRMHALMALYNNLEVTRGFGYQGPSYAQGGYLERGFNDLKWVPEPGRED